MAQNFIFQRKIDGVIKDFYPKTNTNLVTRETSSGEQTVDDILDKKGGFIPYSEESADKQTDTELMFDIVENASSSEEPTTTRGTVVGETPPDDTRYLWADSSGEDAELKYYNDTTSNWEPIKIEQNDIELVSDIVE